MNRLQSFLGIASLAALLSACGAPAQTQMSAPVAVAAPPAIPASVPRPADLDFDHLWKTKMDDYSFSRAMNPRYADPIAALEGKPVRIKGYMAPYDHLDNMKKFMLMAVPNGCFYCEPPSPIEVVLVRQSAENPKFVNEPVAVEGTLRLWKKESPDDPDLAAFIYILDDAKLEPIAENEL